jgi:putative methylase
VQKRLVRKLDLERLLSKIEVHPSPRPDLEQYTIPADVAATMLRIAAYVNDHIVGKRVLDLGCGTGRLALGAAFLGAKQVVGVDVDRIAVGKAVENSAKTCLKESVHWVVADIKAIRGDFDTVLQNPPFGVQKRGADRVFLERALECGNIVYSLHVHPEKDALSISELRAAGLLSVSGSSFMERFVEKCGGKIRVVYAMVMAVPRMFDFHTKKRHEFVVDLYVIEKK